MINGFRTTLKYALWDLAHILSEVALAIPWSDDRLNFGKEPLHKRLLRNLAFQFCEASFTFAKIPALSILAWRIGIGLLAVINPLAIEYALDVYDTGPDEPDPPIVRSDYWTQGYDNA